jgi:hypothetical protein
MSEKCVDSFVMPALKSKVGEYKKFSERWLSWPKSMAR